MTDVKDLELQIQVLEKRLKQVEDLVAGKTNTEDEKWADELFEMARGLVIKHNKASVIFLQRHLMIDIHRAAGLLRQLEEAGIVSSADGTGVREVKTKS